MHIRATTAAGAALEGTTTITFAFSFQNQSSQHSWQLLQHNFFYRIHALLNSNKALKKRIKSAKSQYTIQWNIKTVYSGWLLSRIWDAGSHRAGTGMLQVVREVRCIFNRHLKASNVLGLPDSGG